MAVYPRRCGEHESTWLAMFREHGLSPQVRGTLLPDLGRLRELRFIPAGAGNTQV